MAAADLEPAARKELLRGALRDSLAGLDPDRAAAAAGNLAARLLALPEVTGSRGIFTCLSFGVEIDTWHLAERLLAAGHELYVPRVHGDRMTIHRYPCGLETLSFGLAQPLPHVPAVAAERVDLAVGAALVLGLAFDRRGYRLGYGRGHFDRFLAGRPFPAIGLAHHRQLVEHLPTQPHDVPMALVATDETVVRCAAAG
jgi:5-formyltetrahydrofolate cyclo-ligase